MRYMRIEADVRLKNFESLVDLIEQDGGTLISSSYTGLIKKPVNTRKKARKRCPNITRNQALEILKYVKDHPRTARTPIVRKFNISHATLARILSGSHVALKK